jgi:hypothetical protein
VSVDATRIPIAGTSELRADLRRSRLLRLVLAAALLLTLAGGVFAARADTAPPTIVARGSDGVIVLDVSGSVGPREYRQVAKALEEAAESGRRYGLVVFSDVAYEVFPPGTDPAQVRALSRFFTPLARNEPQRLGLINAGAHRYEASPWTGSLTGGTRISRGLALARTIIRREHLTKPAVVLISDLDYDGQDFPPLEQIIVTYAREHIPVRVVALAPTMRSGFLLERFRELPDTAGADIAIVGAVQSEAQSKSPVVFGLLAALLLVLLGANELACGRLTWLTGDPKKAAA